MNRNIRLYERRRKALLRRLKAKMPLVGGSMVQGFWKCSVPGCRCKKGQLHTAWTLTWKENKKTRTLYIPVDLRKNVEGWNKEYQRLKNLIQEVSELSKIIIRRYVSEKRGRSRYA